MRLDTAAAQCSRFIAAIVLSATFALSGHAKVIEVELDADLFGRLDQQTTACPNTSCGPSAAINSFVFLQNRYPDLYDHKLVPSTTVAPGGGPGVPSLDDQKNAAEVLGGVPYMGTCVACGATGTYVEDFIIGKRDYIEAKVPGKTIYHAQIGHKWRETIEETDDAPAGTHPMTPKPDFVQDERPPELTFLADELKKGQDIELFMFGPDGAHYITLTGLSFDDTTNKGTMKFVDPWGGETGSATIDGLVDGFISTDYTLGSEGDDEMGFIGSAIIESPVPEPAKVGMLLAGLAVLGVGRRLHRDWR